MSRVKRESVFEHAQYVCILFEEVSVHPNNKVKERITYINSTAIMVRPRIMRGQCHQGCSQKKKNKNNKKKNKNKKKKKKKQKTKTKKTKKKKKKKKNKKKNNKKQPTRFLSFFKANLVEYFMLKAERCVWCVTVVFLWGKAGASLFFFKFKQFFICISLYRKYKPEQSIYVIYTEGIPKKVI